MRRCSARAEWGEAREEERRGVLVILGAKVVAVVAEAASALGGRRASEVMAGEAMAMNEAARDRAGVDAFCHVIKSLCT